MTGRLETCLLLAISAPVETADRVHLPPPLRLVTVGDRYFWNLVVCRIHRMRPVGMPEAVGITYHHVAYRIYVMAETAEGPMPGLYFVHSHADNRLVSWAGNLSSDFRFHVGDISIIRDGADVMSAGSSFSYAPGDAFMLRGRCKESPPVPQSGLFSDPEEALQFFKYRPLGLAVGRNGKLKLAEVLRDDAAWGEHQYQVHESRWQLLDSLGITDTRLELASWVEPIDYRWRLGRQVDLSR